VIRRIVGLVERRTRQVKLPRAEVDFLLGHARHLIELVPTFEKHTYRLTARGYVGCIDGPETRYAIAPKIPWRNLCSLLGIARERAGAAAAPAGGLLGALANEFADRLDKVVKSGLVPGYGEQEGVSTFLRGKLRAADQMRDAAASAFPDKFHVDEPVFDLHTPWNRVPKATASALLRRGGLAEDVRKRVESASAPLGPVPDVPATDADFAAALAEPRAEAYRPLLELCRYILTGLNAANPLGTDTGAFLIDLGRAFERYITRSLELVFSQWTGWSLEAQPKIALGPTELQPDIIAYEKGAPRAVIDVKWKTANPESADLHQVLAYATVTGAPHVALVYPGIKYERAHFTTPDERLRVSLVRVRVVGSSTKLARSIERFVKCL
jgi:5-methylcytosine-specific restriction enzyme subunit McrC